jgi:hypothetical protein
VTTVEADLREAIDRVTEAATAATEAATAATRAANAATSAANASTAAFQQISGDLGVLRRDFGVLWRKVNGSDPPPGDAGLAPAEIAGATPLDELAEAAVTTASSALAKTSETSLEVAALEGRMIAGFSTIAKELKAQSASMGVGKRGLAWAMSPAGAKAIFRNLGAAAALVAAIAGLANACHQPAPAPAAAVVHGAR